MTVEELDSLIKKAEDVLGLPVRMVRISTGSWHIYKADCDSERNCATLTECIARLKQWATPPKPKTLTLTLPTTYCELTMNTFNRHGQCMCEVGGEFQNALAEALAPYQEKGN